MRYLKPYIVAKIYKQRRVYFLEYGDDKYVLPVKNFEEAEEEAKKLLAKLYKDGDSISIEIYGRKKR